MKAMTAVLFVAALGLPGVAGAGLVNGGFDTGDFTGWTQTGDPSDFSVDSFHPNPFSGPFYADFTSFGSEVCSISQVVTANPGDQVQIQFALANNITFLGAASDTFDCTFDGASLMNVTNYGRHTFQLITFNVTVASANPTLVFTFSNDDDFWDLDAVAANPAPAPGAMALVGAGVLVISRRRRRA